MNNKRYIYYMLIICTLLLFSCNYRHKQEITIFYFCGNIEPYRQFDCTDLDSICKTNEYDDTIFITSTMFKQIKDDIINAKPTNNYSNSYTPIIYVNVGNQNLCLNGINNQCWIKQSDRKYHPSILSNKTVYLLKWKSFYYNYLPYDILQLDKGIRQFGIPSDYKKDQINKIIKKKEMSKVLVRVK